MDLESVLSGVVAGGLAGPAAVWFLKTFLARRITHDFDKKLESVKHEFDTDLESRKSSLALSAAAHSTATASMIARQSAAHERTMNSVELLWEDHLAATTKMEEWAILADGPILDDSVADPTGWGFNMRITEKHWKMQLGALLLNMHEKGLSLDMIFTEFAGNLEKSRILIGENTYTNCVMIYKTYIRTIAILIESYNSNTHPKWREDEPLRCLVDALADEDLQRAMEDLSTPYIVFHAIARSRFAGFLAAVMRGEELGERTHSKAIELASITATARSTHEEDSE